MPANTNSESVERFTEKPSIVKRYAVIVGLFTLLARAMLVYATVASGVCAGTPKPIQFEIVRLQTRFGSLTPSFLVIRSTQDWAKYWMLDHEKLTSGPGSQKPPEPEVNFNQHTLLVAYNGVKMSGANHIEITAVLDLGAQIEVEVETESSGDCPRTQNISYGYVAALIPRTQKPIKFGVTDKACKSGGGWTVTTTYY
jgi:hypothetical protein